MKTKKTIKSVTNSHSEAKIINMKDYAAYNKKLAKILQLTRKLGDEIHNSLFELAVLDKWKEWDEKQPIGAEIFVTDDMLRDTGDKNIDLLWQILDRIIDVEAEMRVSKTKNDTTDDSGDFDDFRNGA